MTASVIKTHRVKSRFSPVVLIVWVSKPAVGRDKTRQTAEVNLCLECKREREREVIASGHLSSVALRKCPLTL